MKNHVDNSLNDFDVQKDSDTFLQKQDMLPSNNSIVNLDEIIKARINNAFALANKKILSQEIDKLKLLNDYTFDQNIGYLVCEILNSKFRVASEDIIVLSYEYDSIVKQNLENLEKMENVYNDLTSSSKKFAIITDDEWDKLKNEFIQKLKKGEHYQVYDEPEKKFKIEENDDIIVDEATLLFGDIVEID